MVNPLSLYFHIPFCTKKCPYCHFFVLPNRPKDHDLLLEGLFLELDRLTPWIKKHTILSIYFGGGTPSLLGPEAIGILVEAVKERFLVAPDCEITLEANPENVTSSLMKGFCQVGVNRLSIGVQSLDDTSLASIGRGHVASCAIEAIEATYKSGIENISIDLMYDLPNQTFESFEKTLQMLGSLPITHLSLYNLTIEPHTPFSKQKLTFPKEEESLRMLQAAVKHLEAIGLKRYEISAFAKRGKISKHNTGYWTGRPFFGLGPSAFSYYEGSRMRNIPNLMRYCKHLRLDQSPIDFKETLPHPQNIQERLAVALRLIDGVDLKDWVLPSHLETTLQTLEKEGYLLRKDQKDRGQICLSEKGLLFYDTVASELV